jgi:hypothetical protein
MKMDNNELWKKSDTDIFWAEIAPCEHIVQIYESDEVFLDALTGFVGGGIKTNESVIVIASQAHLNSLHERLNSYAIRVDDLISEERYIPLDADLILSKFMVNNWPDEELFIKTVASLMGSLRKHDRPIRAFGEMVAILWAKGNSGATVYLEHLWNRFCEKAAFCLFCAYPKNGFTEDMNSSMQHICSAHSKMIKGSGSSLTALQYKSTAPETGHYKVINSRNFNAINPFFLIPAIRAGHNPSNNQ